MSAEADTRSPKPEVEAVEDQDVSPKHLIDLADRAMALKQWDKAADDYAQALDGLKDDHEEDAPILAPILHRYGRSLLEHAIATSGALGGGGGQQEAPMPQRKPSNKAAGPGEGSSNAVAGSSKQGSATSKPSDPRFSFSGDAEDDEEDEEDEGEAQGGEAGAQDDDDDLGVAFAVLDLARLVYQKLVRPEGSETDDPTAKLETINGQVWDGVKVKSELAEVLNDLGDVGLESENFQQASSDYAESLSILSPLLHPHSRRLADAYLRLGLALEFHPDPEQQQSASKYVESATNTLRKRLEALEQRSSVLQQGDVKEARVQAAAAELREVKAQEEDSKEALATAAKEGKGKAAAAAAVEETQQPAEKDDVLEMDEVRVERETKDVREMITELEAKIEDTRSGQAGGAAAGSAEAGGSAAGAAGMSSEDTKAALAKAINDAFVGASTNALASGSKAPSGPVNDLSGMVKKRKKAPAAADADAGLKTEPAAVATSTATATGELAGESAAQDAGASGSGSGQGPTKKARVEDAEE